MQQEIVERCLPQLLQHLLECDEQQKHIDYDNCLKYATVCIANHNEPADAYDSVEENLTNFIERFHLECLGELGDTVKLLSQVILDDQQLQEEHKWSVLDFMLSVNFRAFNTARMYLKDLMACREQLLRSLDWAYSYKKKARFNAEQQQGEMLQKRSFDLDSELDSIGDISLSAATNPSSVDLSLDLSLLSSHESSAVSPQQETAKDQAELEQARQRYSLALSQLQEQQQQPKASIDEPPNEPRPVAAFAVSFGNYLHQPLQDVQQAVQQYGEEGFLLREVLAMFFQPRSCRYFEMDKQLLQLRSNAATQQLLSKFLAPLQHMQLLQLFIDCYQQGHLETLSSLTAALRRLLKPVVETLTYFEQRVAIDPKQATLRCLLRAMRSSLPRLQLLWSLAVGSYTLPPQQQLCIAAHCRSQYIVFNLLQLAALPAHLDAEGRRGSAAALLLHVLQVYCQFLDSWWLLGDFQDWYAEFPAEQQLIDGRTQYVMRPLEDEDASELSQSPIYQIIERHIVCAGKSLAVLYDANRLGHFVGVHHALLKKSLYHMLIKTLLPQLKPYQLEPLKKQPKAPDIFRQLRATDNEQLRGMYYAYYKESQVDFKLPHICTIDELLKQCLSCVNYAPLHELICRSLDRVLEPRVLLVNSFVVHLIREQLKLQQVLAELRQVYLLLDFEEFAKQLEIALHQLEQGFTALARQQLQEVLDQHNTRVAYPFSVTLPSADLDQLSLLYRCDAALDCIIYDSQLDLYNIAYRRQLQLHVAIRKLQQLPTLNFTSTLQSCKANLELALQQQLKLPQLQQAAVECNAHLELSVSLPQLQLAHNTFVQQMCCILLTDNDDEELLQELLMLANILAKHWLRLQRVFATPTEASSCSCNVDDFADFDAQFDELKIDYLLSVNKWSDAMQCLLD